MRLKNRICVEGNTIFLLKITGSTDMKPATASAILFYFISLSSPSDFFFIVVRERRREKKETSM